MSHIRLNTNVYLLSFCVLLCLLLTSCWDRQGHETSGPELPNYTVSGTVYSSDTNGPLSGAVVHIDATQTTTDSLGRYAISNIVGGASHSFSVTRSGYDLFSSGFQLGYADMDSMDVILGKQLFFSDQIQGPGSEPNGLVWVDGYPWSSDGIKRRIYLLDEEQRLDDVAHVDSPGSYPPKDVYTTPYGMTASEEGGLWYLWVSVAFDDGGRYVYKMTAGSGGTISTDSRYDTPESVYGPDVGVVLNDLDYDGTNVWSCSAGEGRIYKHGPDMSVLAVYDVSDKSPTGIAWAGNVLWMTTDGYNALYMLDGETLDILGYYTLPGELVVGLHYRNGYLWACRHGGSVGYFQKYRVN